MYTYISNAKHSFRCLSLLVISLLFLATDGFAQKYVVTDVAKEKAAKLAAEKANRPKKLIYAVEKKNMVQRFLEDSTSVLNGLQLNADLVGPIQSMLSDKKYYEVGALISIKDIIYPALELGYGNTDYKDIESGTLYKCGGLYGRVGFNVNVMKNKHDDYKVFLGARAAYTNFKFDVSVPDAVDPVWGGNAEYKIKDASCNYLWLEVLAGVDARIAGPIHLGWTMRYKRKMHNGYDGVNKAWYVPGYGNDDTSGFGASFTVGIEFADIFKKKKGNKIDAILNELDQLDKDEEQSEAENAGKQTNVIEEIK